MDLRLHPDSFTYGNEFFSPKIKSIPGTFFNDQSHPDACTKYNNRVEYKMLTGKFV